MVVAIMDDACDYDIGRIGEFQTTGAFPRLDDVIVDGMLNVEPNK
jgi:hypothetical protein